MCIDQNIADFNYININRLNKTSLVSTYPAHTGTPPAHTGTPPAGTFPSRCFFLQLRCFASSLSRHSSTNASTSPSTPLLPRTTHSPSCHAKKKRPSSSSSGSGDDGGILSNIEALFAQWPQCYKSGFFSSSVASHTGHVSSLRFWGAPKFWLLLCCAVLL